MTIGELKAELAKFKDADDEELGATIDHGDVRILGVCALKDEEVEPDGFKYLLILDD